MTDAIRIPIHALRAALGCLTVPYGDRSSFEASGFRFTNEAGGACPSDGTLVIEALAGREPKPRPLGVDYAGPESA